MRRPHRKPLLRYDKAFGLIFIAPWLIGAILFKFLPILASLVISFTDFQLLTPEKTQFVGLENYAGFFRDRWAGYVLFQSIAEALTSIPLQLIAAVLLASFLNSPRLKARNALRTLFFVPSIIPSIAILFMWWGFTDPATGWLNRLIIQPLGLGAVNDVYAEGARSFFFGISSLWSIGPGMLIMLGAMQSLSPEVQEAARVDGAGPFMRFFAITLPLISPAIFFALVINLITIFGGVILLDRGNPFSGGNSPYDGYIAHQLFDERNFGYAAGLAWVFFILVMVVIYVLFSTARRWVYYPDRDA